MPVNISQANIKPILYVKEKWQLRALQVKSLPAKIMTHLCYYFEVKFQNAINIHAVIKTMPAQDAFQTLQSGKQKVNILSAKTLASNCKYTSSNWKACIKRIKCL